MTTINKVTTRLPKLKGDSFFNSNYWTLLTLLHSEGLVLETKTARIPKHSVGEGFQQSFGTLPTLLTLLHPEGGGNQRLKYQ